MATHIDSMELPKRIAILGSGVAGLSCAWLLSQKHHVTLYEKDDRIGGHANTVTVNGQSIDTGFIVYNETNYPNLVQLFDHLDIKTNATDMSFGVSIPRNSSIVDILSAYGKRISGQDQHFFEYCGSDLAGMFAQKRNILNPRMWRLLRDLVRFYKNSENVLNEDHYVSMTLGDYLKEQKYSQEFIHDHIVPMGAAIWSTPSETMMAYPIRSFIRFCKNHGLLKLKDRPKWRTVIGGSKQYVDKISESFKENIRLNTAVTRVWSHGRDTFVEDRLGHVEKYDAVVLAGHADQSFSLLPEEYTYQRKLLSKFKYQPNVAHLHDDENFMPCCRKAWSSWNYIERERDTSASLTVTYWMNRLQKLETDKNYFVTLNPVSPPSEKHILRSIVYHHPIFDRAAITAQKMLWNMQGHQNIWYCGSYFGFGFHEDALQSGLAVAESLGEVKRPWHLENPSSRITILGQTNKNTDVEAA